MNPPSPMHPRRAGVVSLSALLAMLSAVLLVAAPALLTGCTPKSPIQQENELPGTPQAVWDVTGAGDPSIQGFATQMSVNKGETVEFKVATDASAYDLEIYRLGYYQGNGARLVTTLLPTAALPQTQPSCLSDGTGLIDCGNWSTSASWAVPTTAMSGIYLARLRRTDNGGASHIVFVVRDDARNAEVLFQTSDTTWQAWNDYGGNSLHAGNPPEGRAFKVSYNRPFRTRAVDEGRHWLFNAEYPMLRWLEANGYDVAYTTGVQADRAPASLLNHKVYVSNGEDAYWSAAQRANVEAASAAGVHLAFFSGSTAFWKARYEPSIDGSGTSHRTLVSYRETLAGAVIDPAQPVWTGTWRDARFSPPGDGGRPENALVGSLFQIGAPLNEAIQVSGSEGRLRFWRATSLATMPIGDIATLAPGSLGAEIGLDVDNGFRPPGLVGVSSTPVSSATSFLLDPGATYGAGSGTHKLTLYRHPVSAALVFSAGSHQWAWGLDPNHDRANLGATPDVRMQQATVNLLSDMGVVPAGLQVGLTYLAQPPDTTPPTAAITSPAPGATLVAGSPFTVTGTAADLGGSVAGVEVSTDGGTTWHPADGRTSWSYVFVPAVAGPTTVRARAIDQDVRLGAASAPVPITVDAPVVTLVSIAVEPAGPVLAPGATLALAATGTYSNATTQDLTTQVAWTSSNEGVVTVAPGGLATAVGPGTANVTATFGTVSGSTAVTVQLPQPSITTTSLSAAAAGVAYGATLAATGGTPPYTWAIVGALPPGLSLDDGTGVISGVPTVAGNVSFTAQVTDAASQTASQGLEIVVAPAPLVSIAVTPAAPSVIVGGTQAFTATGSYADTTTQDLSAQVTWASSAPAVATVDAAGLATTLTVGTATITATLGPVSGGTTLTVAPPPLVLTTATLPGGTVTVAYAETLAATGGTPPYAWSVTGTLPPGLGLDSGTGAITGTPTAAGTTSFVAQVTDAALVTATAPLQIAIAPVPLLSIALAPLEASIVVGATQPFTATGTFADASTGDITSQVLWASSAPEVATVSVGGLASAVAPGTTTISATLGVVQASTTLSVAVAPLVLTTATLPDATANLGYTAALAATGGTAPYTFAVAAGLPPGVSLSPTGQLSGTPTTPGVYAFTAEVTDAALQTASGGLQITVNAAQSIIQQENALPGAPPSEWDVVGAGDPSIQGFATDISVNKGQTVDFKIDTDASAYVLEIYRMGYYQGNGARRVATINPSATLPQIQPACLDDTATGLIDCGNWAVSASWAVPANAVSGIYFARLERTDNGGASHVVFIVRDDARTADIVFQTADTTWQAYNEYGGNSLYVGSPNGRARKVSYNRPFTTRAVANGTDWLFNSEYPMVRWLEANGYDVQYITGVDSDRNGALLLNRKLYMSNGHDEYWSGTQRANVEAALAAGTNLAFFSGNKIFWKTRWEPSIDGSTTPHRTLVCYKETLSGLVTDPAHPTWTGTWRDARFSPPADGGRPENALGGSIFMINGEYTGAITVSGEEGRMRFWRGTSLATLPLGDTVTLAPGSLGAELDVDLDNGFRPPGLVGLTSTPIVTGSLYLLDNGSNYGAGSATHKLTLHRHPTSGAAVFATGTYQWSWGLDANHDRSGLGAVTDVRMQQATVNLFADVNVAPATLQPGLAYVPLAPDTTPPTAAITSPAPGAVFPVGANVTIAGTAADVGGVVGGVEVSTDGGATWHPATGRGSWSYTWTAGPAGAATILARASDDSARLGAASAPVAVVVGTPPPCSAGCSIWSEATTPTVPDNGPDADVEVGVKFRATAAGFVTALRFYKDVSNVGPHVGHLWTAGGVLLGTATFTNETASGWQQASFSSPVPVAADTVYVASYHAPGGHYARDEGFFTAQGVTSPPLEALQSSLVTGPNGLYGYGPAGTFPTQTYLDTNYWVDVVFNQASLVSIAVAPASPSIAFGATQAFTATGTFSDTTTQDLTSQVLWGTSNAAVATIAAGGVATGTGGGNATITATFGAVSGSAALTVAPPPPSVTTTSLQGAAVGVAYNATLVGSGGTPPYAWTVAAGALPPGLALSGASGVISGIPSAAGSYAFTAQLTDAASVTATRALEIVVAPAPLVALQVTPDGSSIASGGTQQFTATGTYADASTQDLSGVVSWGSANPGVVSISAAGLATAVAPGTTQITATLGAISDGTSVSVQPGPNLAVLTASLPTATVTVPYAASLEGSGGTPPYTWAVIGSLPPGIVLDGNTGALSGTPTASGFSSFVVQVTDATLATASRPLGVSVAPAPLVSIAVTPENPSVSAGGTQAFVATGTYADASTQLITSQVTWASSSPGVATVSAGGLATGVSVGSTTISATRGEISASTLLTVTAPPISITTSSLPDATFGMLYSAPPLSASGGTLPYTWAIASGLPPGLSLEPSTGVISGTPTVGGVFSFTVQVTDAALLSVTRSLQITVPEIQTFTIWPSSTVPVVVDSADTGAVEVGVKFRSSEAGFITGIRFYKAETNVGPHVGNLWSEAGDLLATATFTNETASGWQEVTFGAPVPIAANTVYVASYFAPSGHYSLNELYFSSGQFFENPPLRALSSFESGGNGVYAYGATSSFPNQSYQATNYWVDVVFAGEPPPALTAITVTPPSPTLTTGGGTQQFSATGTFADSSTLDLTGQVTWGSSNAAVATVSATGLATALTPGSVTLTATLGAVSGTAGLTVQLGTLAVATTSLPQGTLGTPYTAILAPSGGVSPYTWSVTGTLPPGLALSPTTGVISGIPTAIGSFPITVEVGDGSAQNASAPLTLTIAAVPVLSSIAVTPAAPTVATGTTRQMTATGTLSNGATQDVTTQVVWSTSAQSVATVDAAGLATAFNPGTATLTATLGAVSGSATLTATAGTPQATEGPGGPILVVTHAGNPYSRYLAEILRAEGFHAFSAMDVALVTPAVLAGHDVVLLGDFPLTAAQAAMIDGWVATGGNLIAMRPDKQLAATLGLTDVSATLQNAYLQVATASGPGVGIVGETIQYKGAADLYALSGATAVATLYASATTPTGAPAVTLHGSLLGQAAAFTYDLARSVAWQRQGNPAWGGTTRTGVNPIRSVELFYGASATDPQPDWVDLDKVEIPQADEQQRLLANLIVQMNLATRPLPRFWYLPSFHKAAIVMTGDDHNNQGTAARFNSYLAESPPGCSVADWECVRSTSYIYTGSLTTPQAQYYEGLGFEVSLHVDTGCANWLNDVALNLSYGVQLGVFAAAYPGVPAPTTNRTHCVVWSDYDTQPQVELANGIRLDTTYYYFPASWVGDRPGFMTGSGMPMRFTDRRGVLIDVYQAATQMTDESSQTFPFTIDTLLDNALGAEGYYGVFTANMHTDAALPFGAGAGSWAGSYAIVDSAQARGVPIVSARQMLQWLDGRNASSFGAITWDGALLSFTVTAGAGANNLRGMLPLQVPGETLNVLTRDGIPISFTTATVKGVTYAIFPATTGAYQATYQ